ncbi:MAG: asparagine synthetase B, partial [Bacillales bacterium]|nr:asparagine synthetase B [Bacillales bacterium]
KNELHDWVVQLIHESQVDYLINKHYVLDLLADHVANKTDNSRKIWTVLIFMLWHQIYIENVYPLESLQKKKKEIVVG